MNILVIFTGGTIGSTTKGRWTALDGATHFTLLDRYTAQHADGVEFTTCNPYSILSENLTAGELNCLTETVMDAHAQAYDGIIVTHGTDTLQYAAAALSYCLPAAKVPVILVSANHPLEHPDTNGHVNFEAAVSYIRSGCPAGVFASYKNADRDRVDFHLGSRIYSHLENTDALYSLGGAPFAYYQDGKVTCDPAFQASDRASQNRLYKFADAAQVMVIHSLPGDRLAYPLDDCKAVLLRPYHSGTVNTGDGRLKAFCERAKAQGVPVFILCAGLGADYSSTNVFSEYGIKVLPVSTFIAAYTKLWIAVSNGLDLDEFMARSLAEECI